MFPGGVGHLIPHLVIQQLVSASGCDPSPIAGGLVFSRSGWSRLRKTAAGVTHGLPVDLIGSYSTFAKFTLAFAGFKGILPSMVLSRPALGHPPEVSVTGHFDTGHVSSMSVL